MKILILGIGNPILRDDGVGIHAANAFKEALKQLNDADFAEDVIIEVGEASTGGFNVLEMILGYEKVVIIDGIKTEDGSPGEVYRLELKDFSKALHFTSPHDTNIVTALEFGYKCVPQEMPRDIVIIGVEVECVDEFGTEMTPKVKSAIPKVVDMIFEELQSVLKVKPAGEDKQTA
ncbi:MAG TPA: hydrogenase maturation protease [Methanomicrobia archaeon]|nr:hydrogenase maturation protease [Methanomicrobia archaeon]HEX59696.1 hydrogenase maturation protease [Methanomicrobia archaeon]